MSDGRILVERVSTTKSAAKTQSIGLITVRTQTDTREYSISTAVDTTNGETVNADEVWTVHDSPSNVLKTIQMIKQMQLTSRKLTSYIGLLDVSKTFGSRVIQIKFNL